MLNKLWLIIVLLVGVWSVPTTAQENTKTYIAPDGSFLFDYPSGFNFAEDGDPFTLRGTTQIDGADLEVVVFGPENTYLPTSSLSFDGSAGRLTDLVMLYSTPYRGAAVGEVITNRNITMRIEERDVALMGLFSAGQQIFLYAIEFDNGQFGVMTFEMPLEAAEANQSFFESMVATFNSVPEETLLAAEATAESEATLVDALRLENYAEGWSAAVEELQSLGLIASDGGTIVLLEETTILAGLEDDFAILGTGIMRTHVVMGSTLTFSPQGAEAYETCSLIGRVTLADEALETYFQMGIDSDGDLFYQNYPDEEMVFELLSLDLAESHQMTFIMLEDRVTLFLDGVQIFADVVIEEREAFFGMAFAGEHEDSQCEFSNSWVYSSPPFTPGLCTASSPGGAVNKREGAGTNFARVGQLNNEPLEITAQTIGTDGFTWYQLEDESFVREDVIARNGDCSAVPQLDN